MINIVITVLIVTSVVAGIGLLLGVVIGVFSKILAVEVDKKVEDIIEVLPGANCGVCGFAGCANYADGIVNSDAEINLCAPGGKKVSSLISGIMGKSDSSTSSEPQVAFVSCRAKPEDCSSDYVYSGLKDCNSISMFYGGNKSCKYGCLGGGSCISVCPVEAISYDEFNRVVIDKNICIGCKKCLQICPIGVIKMIPKNANYVVPCNSHDKGAVVKKKCKVGCIGCSICAKKFPNSSLVVDDFLADVDYNKNMDLDEALGASKACPAKCIIKR